MNANQILPWASALALALCLTAGCNVAEGSADIPGNAARFDPVESLPAVSAFAGKDMLLVGITARYVKPDGTLDLTAEYKPTVSYSFFGEGEYKIPPPEEKPDTPLGVKRESPSREVIPYWHYVSVYLDQPHWLNYELNGEDTTEWHPGMRRIPSRRVEDHDEIEKFKSEYRALPLPLPLSAIWKQAIAAGAPSENAVASIDFQGGSYRFEIEGTGYKFTFDRDGRFVE